MRRWIVAAGLAACSLGAATPASAQAGDLRIRGFGDIGSTIFAAGESFSAVLGRDGGTVFGGGAEAVLPQRVFLQVRVSRFREQGERVFVFNDEQFELGIPTIVTVTPLEVSGGYRFGAARVVPYVGAGLGWHRLQETSQFAEPGEDVNETHQGYQILGGAEVRLTGWLGAAAEAQWATVPDALGDDPNSVSAAFGESDLGGVTLRVKVVIGR